MRIIKAITLCVLLTACLAQEDKTESTSPASTPTSQSTTEKKAPEISYAPSPKPAGWKCPSDIEVMHILISFDAVESKLPRQANLTQDEALKLAKSLVVRIRNGEDMSALVKEHTQDTGNMTGIYQMTEGTPTSRKVIPRRAMVSGFGDISYSLDVGEVSMTMFDAATSPYGYHVIKRIK